MPTPRKAAKSARKSSTQSSKSAAKKSSAKSAAKKRGSTSTRGASSSRSRSAQSRGSGRSATKSAAARRNRVPNALELLTADHREVQKNFRKAERMDSDDAQLQELVRTTCTALTLHAQIEEEIFYPAVRAGGDNEDLLEEATVEHDVAKELIAQLESMTGGGERFKATFKVLGEYVNHHIEEEESQMFRAAKRAKLDLVALGEEIMAAKQGATETGSNRPAGGARSARGGTQSGGSRSNVAERNSRRGGRADAAAAEAADEADDESMIVGSTGGDTGEGTERPGRGGRSLSATSDSGDDTEVDVETPGSRDDGSRRQTH